MIHTFIKAHRKRSVLSQDQCARLLGIRRNTHNELENGKRGPTVEHLLKLEVVFGASPRLLFPEQYEKAEEAVMAEAKVLLDELEGKEDEVSADQRAFLGLLPFRAQPPFNPEHPAL